MLGTEDDVLANDALTEGKIPESEDGLLVTDGVVVADIDAVTLLVAEDEGSSHATPAIATRSKTIKLRSIYQLCHSNILLEVPNTSNLENGCCSF